MEPKILIFCIFAVFAQAQIIAQNELQGLLKKYLTESQRNSNSIFAHKITQVIHVNKFWTIFSILDYLQVSEISGNEVTFKVVSTVCHRETDPEQVDDCEINDGEKF